VGSFLRLAAVIDADVSNPKQVVAAFDQAIACVGSGDVLINNVGIGIRQEFLDITPQGCDEVIRVNLTGAFHVA